MEITGMFLQSARCDLQLLAEAYPAHHLGNIRSPPAQGYEYGRLVRTEVAESVLKTVDKLDEVRVHSADGSTTRLRR